MARVFAFLLVHRLLLVGIAFFALSQGMQEGADLDSLAQGLWEKVELQADYLTLKSKAYGFSTTFGAAFGDPWLTVVRGIVRVTKAPPGAVLFFLSNLFFLLFIVECYGVVTRVLPEKQSLFALALIGSIPWSWQMNLFSEYSLICFLSILCLHRALLSRWHVAGFAAGILYCVSAPGALFVLPLGFAFYYFHRGQIFRLYARELLMFVLLFAACIWMKPENIGAMGEAIRRSSLINLSGLGFGLSSIDTASVYFSLLLLLGGVLLSVLHFKGLFYKWMAATLFVLMLLVVPAGGFRVGMSMAGFGLAGYLLQLQKKIWLVLGILWILSGILVYAQYQS